MPWLEGPIGNQRSPFIATVYMPPVQCWTKPTDDSSLRTVLLTKFHKNKNSETFKKLSFLDKTIQNIFTSPNNWLKHTVLQWRSTIASTALCRVAPWCSRRTVKFRHPLSTLTSIQNLGGSWFSLPSIDLHSNYDNFRRTSSSISELLEHELTCCPPNQMIREWI